MAMELTWNSWNAKKHNISLGIIIYEMYTENEAVSQ